MLYLRIKAPTDRGEAVGSTVENVMFKPTIENRKRRLRYSTERVRVVATGLGTVAQRVGQSTRVG